jgi:pimeloyl-ACP methyl ester carboxylesterase
VPSTFIASHRGGSGPPLLCLHGFADTWRTWDLVLPALEREHEVLAPTLAGHAGGPPVVGEIDESVLAGAVERALDETGWETAHIVGNSLGGYVALQLAARGRARSVVALAPAGGFAAGDDSYRETLAYHEAMLEAVAAAAPHADAILASPQSRRRATRYTATRFEHIPVELLAHQIRGAAACEAGLALIEHGYREGWPLDAERIECPVRIVWGTADRILPWPRAAARFRDDLLPHADWVELDGVAHLPQLDVPLETAQLILGFTSESSP